MRSLNKIIFINSAHIRYKEINLNGNVHFVGTQGVGKSTLLRAILFFYNGDKQKLGIPKEKKSFDEFYLENANSYIAYEVLRDESTFCVLVSKSQGRACFRFINGTFDRKWLVSEQGEVTADSSVIRERITKAGLRFSKLVDSYEMYRDIIYGNHQGNNLREFYSYSITESPNYQNIPRSIQNVFRNSKLDADFIKDTIISSIDDATASIDLRYFRNQVSEFEQEYNDIGNWFKKDNRGIFYVKEDAKKVVENYRHLLHLGKQIEDFCKQLNYAYKIAKEQLPSIANTIKELEESINKIQKYINEEKSRYEKERDKLVGEQSINNQNLKRILDQRDYYEKLNIEEIKSKALRESIIIAEKRGLENEKNILTSKNLDITAKYENLEVNLKQKLEQFKQNQRSIEGEKKTDILDQNQKSLELLTSSSKNVEDSYKDKLADAQEKIDALNEEDYEIREQIKELNYKPPFEENIHAAKEQLDNLKNQKNSLEISIVNKQRDIEKLLGTRDSAIKEKEYEYQKKIEANEREYDQINASHGELQQILKNQEGSYYEWLQANKKDWLETIGKIADEALLYSKELRPTLANNANQNFFGTNINVESLPIKARSPEELQQELARTKDQLEKNKKQKEELLSNLDAERKSIERIHNPKIKSFRESLQQDDANLQMLPSQQKKAKVELESWQQKSEEQLKAIKQELQTKLEICSSQKVLAKETLEGLNAAKEGAKRSLQNEFNSEKRQRQLQLDEFSKAIASEIANKEAEYEAECAELKIQKENELRAKNVDIKKLQHLDSQINALSNELDEINKNRKHIYEYEKDKRELFDNEAKWKSLQKELREKLENLSTKYESLRQKNQLKLNDTKSKQAEQKSIYNRMENCISETEKFISSDSNCPKDIELKGELSTHNDCLYILNELKYTVYSRKDQKDVLRKATNKFKGYFSAKNTFNFKTELQSDEDYQEFASNLDDFLLNNKIEDYRKRTSNRYTEIIGRISHEVGNVTKQKSDVLKIINDVNRDFKEKNFAGVIKNIELRAVESSDRLMQLLVSIKKFNDENQHNFGEVNLFSDSNRDNVNQKAVEYLLKFVKLLNENANRQVLQLADSFQLQFNIKENDNDTGWIEKISNVGSDGTDILVKAMVNIMLINVFKERISRKFGDFRIHCMMDEIGKLHISNVKGILKFANTRNIYLINGSPSSQSASDYRYTYLLSKNSKSETEVKMLLSRAE